MIKKQNNALMGPGDELWASKPICPRRAPISRTLLSRSHLSGDKLLSRFFFLLPPPSSSSPAYERNLEEEEERKKAKHNRINPGR